MADLIMEFSGSGHTGQHSKMELYEDKIIIIKKKGGLGRKLGSPGQTGDRTVFLDQISSIQVYEGGLMSPGFMRIMLPGSAAEGKYNFADARQDDNAIVFTSKKDAKLAHKFKDAFEEVRSKMSRQSSGPQITQTQLSPSEELRKMKALLEDGIITEEEFNKKKSELLGL